MTPTRRGFLLGLGAALVAAPAIVKATSIMPIKAPKLIVPAAPALETAYAIGDRALYVGPNMMAALKRELSMEELAVDRPLIQGNVFMFRGMRIYETSPIEVSNLQELEGRFEIKSLKVGAVDGQMILMGDPSDAALAT
jgi:hypothetical protein